MNGVWIMLISILVPGNGVYLFTGTASTPDINNEKSCLIAGEQLANEYAQNLANKYHVRIPTDTVVWRCEEVSKEKVLGALGMGPGPKQPDQKNNQIIPQE